MEVRTAAKAEDKDATHYQVVRSVLVRGQNPRRINLLTQHGDTVEIVGHMVFQVCAEAGLDSFKTREWHFFNNTLKERYPLLPKYSD